MSRHNVVEKWGSLFLLIPMIFFLSIFFFYPLVRVFLLSLFDPTFTLRHFSTFIESPVYLKVVLVTMEISFLVTVLCLILGYLAAYAIVSAKDKWASLLLAFVIVSFWTSTLIRTYSWMAMLQMTGVINTILLEMELIKEPIKLMYNLFGVAVGMTHVLLPFMILPLYSTMKGIDRGLLKAAQNLGASPFKAFWKIFLPLSLPGVGAGCLLVFVIALGFFITPAFLGGGKIIMISNLIDIQVSQILNWGLASAISLCLILLTLVLFFLSGRYLGLTKMWST